jgi:hypothetical protein
MAQQHPATAWPHVAPPPIFPLDIDIFALAGEPASSPVSSTSNYSDEDDCQSLFTPPPSLSPPTLGCVRKSPVDRAPLSAATPRVPAGERTRSFTDENNSAAPTLVHRFLPAPLNLDPPKPLAHDTAVSPNPAVAKSKSPLGLSATVNAALNAAFARREGQIELPPAVPPLMSWASSFMPVPEDVPNAVVPFASEANPLASQLATACATVSKATVGVFAAANAACAVSVLCEPSAEFKSALPSAKSKISTAVRSISETKPSPSTSAPAMEVNTYLSETVAAPAVSSTPVLSPSEPLSAPLWATFSGPSPSPEALAPSGSTPSLQTGWVRRSSRLSKRANARAGRLKVAACPEV